MKIFFKGIELEITIESYQPSYPAKINALPEDCYPAEPYEIEWLVSENQEGADFYNEAIFANQNWIEEAEQLIIEGIEDV